MRLEKANMSKWTGSAPTVSIILLLTLPGSSYAADDEGDVPEAPRGKVYTYKQPPTERSQRQDHKMEVYFPPGHDPVKRKVPGVILFHGGGWSGGDLNQFRVACHYLASRGLVAATSNYRKSPAKANHPGPDRKRCCITDAKSAIRWFKQHADELGVDPRRIVTGGGSAGGHIAVLATTNPGLNDPEDAKDIDTSVVAYLLFNPAFSGEDAQDAEVSVMQHLKKDFPPAVVFFGTRDGWKKGWDTAHRKLESLGHAKVDLQLAEKQGHSFFNDEPWRTLTLIASDRFLVRQGLLQGEPTLAPPAGSAELVSEAGPEKADSGGEDHADTP